MRKRALQNVAVRAALVAVALAICGTVIAQDLKVGARAPGFTVADGSGSDISLSDYAGKKNVVLLFNRAHW